MGKLSNILKILISRNTNLPSHGSVSHPELICSNYDSDTSVGSLERLGRFLEEAKNRNIYRGVSAPYAPSIYELMMYFDPPRYGYIKQIEIPVRQLFNKCGFSFFDWSDPIDLDTSDSEFLGGLHASEKIYVRLLLKMIESDFILERYLYT